MTDRLLCLIRQLVTSRNKSTDAIRVTVDGAMELGFSYLWNARFYLDRAEF